MLYMVTFTIHIPQMLAYIPYMNPMGIEISKYIWRSDSVSSPVFFYGNCDSPHGSRFALVSVASAGVAVSLVFGMPVVPRSQKVAPKGH